MAMAFDCNSLRGVSSMRVSGCISFTCTGGYIHPHYQSDAARVSAVGLVVCDSKHRLKVSRFSTQSLR